MTPSSKIQVRVKQVLKWLETSFCLPLSYRFKWEDLGPDYLGCCNALEGEEGEVTGFTLKVSPRLDIHSSVDTVIHEWAHAYTWLDSKEGEDDHSDAFWLAYGMMCRAWYEYASKNTKRIKVKGIK